MKNRALATLLGGASNRVILLYEIPQASLELITDNEDSAELADQYIFEKAITVKYYEYTLHVAIATIHQVSV